MDIDEDMTIEYEGFKNGHNPLNGEWEQTFNFSPVSYSNKSEAKTDFKTKIQSQLLEKYIFTNEIQITITLYLDEEKMLTTPEYGDLDNYAKSICDAIKGYNGLIIDDCQIQRLDISWIDVPQNPYFIISIKSLPNNFMTSENLVLYEMPDKLYYPFSEYFWEEGKLLKMHIKEKTFLINALHDLTSSKKSIKHKLRQTGNSRQHAFKSSQYLSPMYLGFHKTRIIDSGFEIINLKDRGKV